MSQLKCAAVCAAVLALSAGEVAAATEPGKESFFLDVQVQNGLLTLEARNAPMHDVLDKIAQEARFKAILHDEITATVTQTITRLPLAAGLSRLLDEVANFAMVFSKQDDAIGKVRLRELHVYPARPAGQGKKHTITLGPDALSAPTPDVRLEAMRELAQQEGAAAIPTLAGVLQDDDDPAVRGHAAAQLGKIGTADALPSLQAALADEDESVRLRALRALGRIGGDSSAQVLAEILLSHDEVRMQLLAAGQLARSDSTIARPSLEAATSDPDDSVRAAAVRYLELRASRSRGRFKDPQLSDRSRSTR